MRVAAAQTLNVVTWKCQEARIFSRAARQPGIRFAPVSTQMFIGCISVTFIGHCKIAAAHTKFVVGPTTLQCVAMRKASAAITVRPLILIQSFISVILLSRNVVLVLVVEPISKNVASQIRSAERTVLAAHWQTNVALGRPDPGHRIQIAARTDSLATGQRATAIVVPMANKVAMFSMAAVHQGPRAAEMNNPMTAARQERNAAVVSAAMTTIPVPRTSVTAAFARPSRCLT